MKTLSALVFLCAFSLSLAFYDDYMEDPWENEDEAQPEWIKLNGKVYQCDEGMDCDCPRLLCTGEKSCKKGGALPATCKLTKPHDEIYLQDAHRKFFGRKGDCYCQ